MAKEIEGEIDDLDSLLSSSIKDFDTVQNYKTHVISKLGENILENYEGNYLNKKQEALNAFRNASQMTFDLKIQEDAWLNYAKISYEIGNPYQSASQVLSDYVAKYPNSTHKEELETLLIDSYITSKNYVEALKLLEGKRSFENI